MHALFSHIIHTRTQTKVHIKSSTYIKNKEIITVLISNNNKDDNNDNDDGDDNYNYYNNNTTGNNYNYNNNTLSVLTSTWKVSKSFLV